MTEKEDSQHGETNVDTSLATLSRKCSNCGQAGHNSRTCLELRETPATEPELKSTVAEGLKYHNQLDQTEQQTDRITRDEEAEVSDCSVDISKEIKKKGIAWTEEEHKLFLKGLQKLGKGDWRGISRQFVQSRSPTQVASHAQKYFIRQSISGKRKRRSSLFDLVPEGGQDGQDAAVQQATQQSKNNAVTSSVHFADPQQQPGQNYSSHPQGPEAFVFACWYQSMLLQQGSMAWIQALYSQQNPTSMSPSNLEAQEAQAMGLGGAGFSREKQMAVASLAAQQQAASYMAQQHLSAAAAIGAFPYQPLQGAAMGKLSMSDTKELPSYGSSDLDMQNSSSVHQPLASLTGHGTSWQQGKEQASSEIFGNGRLVRPKAHRAQSGQSFGSIPSYMCNSQSEGQTHYSGSSKESEDSLARLCAMSSMQGPSSHAGGSAATCSPSLGLDKSTASEGSRVLRPFTADLI